MTAGRDSSVVLRDVTVSYTRGDHTITPINQLSAEFVPGELVLLLGPSGCGKTTLLSCMAGIMKPTSGSIVVDGQDLTTLDSAGLTRYRRHGVGIVFQAFNLISSLSAVHNVAVPLRAAGHRGSEALARAGELLHQVGLGERMDHRPGRLSGGQQQRVAIARALALDPKFLVADEPTANLDQVQVEVVLRLLRSLTDRGRIVVVSTHDQRLLALADRVLDMSLPLAETSHHGAHEVSLAPGEVLFRQGARGDLLFEVVEGSIELRHSDPDGDDDVVPLAVVGPGHVFGEMAALFELPRSATAVAVGPVRLTAYSVDGFRKVHGAAALRSLVGRWAAG